MYGSLRSATHGRASRQRRLSVPAPEQSAGVAIEGTKPALVQEFAARWAGFVGNDGLDRYDHVSAAHQQMDCEGEAFYALQRLGEVRIQIVSQGSVEKA